MRHSPTAWQCAARGGGGQPTAIYYNIVSDSSASQRFSVTLPRPPRGVLVVAGEYSRGKLMSGSPAGRVRVASASRRQKRINAEHSVRRRYTFFSRLYPPMVIPKADQLDEHAAVDLGHEIVGEVVVQRRDGARRAEPQKPAILVARPGASSLPRRGPMSKVRRTRSLTWGDVGSCIGPLEQLAEVIAIAVAQRSSERFELRGVDEALVVSDLFQAGHLQPLPLLDRLNKIRGL
jgi:hypothetical protein